jgi:acetyl esterase/lipase
MSAITTAVAGALVSTLIPVEAKSPTAFTESFLELQTVPIWPARAPGAKGDGPADTPSLTIFRPELRRVNGTAVIVAPGGGYTSLAANLEGRQVADWFAVRGITAFVLNYRLGERYPYPVPLADALRAIRFVRANGSQWRVLPDRIGMIGFSAGGHLAAMAATSFTTPDVKSTDPVERVGDRPDFVILGYAALLYMEPDPDGSSQYCRAIQTADCNSQAYARYLPEALVRADSPPTFLYHTSDDPIPAEGSIRFYRALRAKGVPCELHVFEIGDHGSGMGSGDPSLGNWPVLLEAWLTEHKLLTRLDSTTS